MISSILAIKILLERITHFTPVAFQDRPGMVNVLTSKLLSNFEAINYENKTGGARSGRKKMLGEGGIWYPLTCFK